MRKKDMPQIVIDGLRKVAHNYWRASVHSVREILEYMRNGEELVTLHGVPVRLTSTRLRTYLKSTACTHCGIKAAFFAVESNTGDFHLNLYALNDKGQTVMMTSDHIIPKSRGGDKNDINNRQCLCTKCNTRKDNKLETELNVR